MSWAAVTVLKNSTSLSTTVDLGNTIRFSAVISIGDVIITIIVSVRIDVRTAIVNTKMARFVLAIDGAYQ